MIPTSELTVDTPSNFHLELGEVRQSGIQMILNTDLSVAFVWSGTPHGHDFWAAANRQAKIGRRQREKGEEGE